MPVKLKKLVTVIAVGFLVVASFVLAGQTANNSTPEPTGYTLEDIYNLIENSTTTGHTLFPTTTTGEPTMHSVSEIYVALANLIDPTKLASTSVTYLGVSGGDTPEEVAPVTKEFAPTSEPGAITGFTLQDITNLIENIRATTTAHENFAPASGPADSGPTLTEIYESLSTLIQAGDIVVGTTYLGAEGSAILSSDKELTSFGFPTGSQGVISGTNITVFMPNGTDVTSLISTFTTNGVTVKIGDDIQISASTANNFSSPVTYRVIAEDGSYTDYTITVTVVDLVTFTNGWTDDRGGMNWYIATAYCSVLGEGSRLPNIDELVAGLPARPDNVVYWSSTENGINYAKYAYYNVSTHVVDVGLYGDKPSGLMVRCIR